ncbi:protein of unknown function [Pseudomonas mediterranea]
MDVRKSFQQTLHAACQRVLAGLFPIRREGQMRLMPCQGVW